jgi:hypothetical protein
LRAGLTILVLLGSTAWTMAQCVHQPPAEVEKRAEALLGKMTLEEKITLIGGVNDFYSCAGGSCGLEKVQKLRNNPMFTPQNILQDSFRIGDDTSGIACTSQNQVLLTTTEHGRLAE